jgi:autotransporter passenger strand-loop-strand repeat protein
MTTVGSGQTLEVTAGQSVDGVFVDGGTLIIRAGGSATNTLVDGGREIVVAGGTATGTRVVNRGFQYVADGLALGSIAGFDGEVVVQGDGIADGVTIEAGGRLLVMSGGTLTGSVANAGSVRLETTSFAGTLSGAGTVSMMFYERVAIGGTNDLSGDITVTGPASLVLSATGAFSGRLTVAGASPGWLTPEDAGLLELTHPLAAGSGPLEIWGEGGTLQIDGLVMPGNVIEAFGWHDVIALPDLAWDPAGTVALRAGNLLEVTANGGTHVLHLDPTQDFSLDFFRLAQKGAGTAVTMVVQATPDDVNGDGTSDLLLGDADGWLSDWSVRNGAFDDWNPPAVWSNFIDAGQQLVAVGDFDGDGRVDLMERDGAGAFAYSSKLPLQYGPNWTWLDSTASDAGAGRSVVGAADTTADGAADLLLQSASSALSWMVMSQGDYGRMVPIGNPAASGYGLVGTGDFNHDGMADLLLADARGNLITWLLADGAYAGWQQVGSPYGAGYGFVGTGDFNRDGSTDILLADARGNLITWLMEGGRYAGWSQLGSPYAQGYGYLQTGDYNGDRTTDILLSDATGGLVVWSIVDGAVATWHSLGNVTGYGLL